MINLPQGFKVGSSDAIDSRLILSKQEMKSINEFTMPEVYLTVCSDDNNIYVYDKGNEFEEETGKFRLYNSDSLSINIEQIQSLFLEGEE